MASPTDVNTLYKSTAAELLPRLRNGDLKVVDLAKSLLARIQQRDHEVKAWVFISPPQILQQAQQLDDTPLAQRGPLFGLPIGVKDVILTKDMPTQYNSRLYESQTPINMDANAIVTLRQAGALIMGKTSTTEFASSKQGNWHQNLTANPYDVERTPGGSSSGSGAAVGDFQVPVALGTQTGGSIVRPASFNGCYGFKPTWGALSREGIAHWSWTLDTLGFFCRSLSDLDPILDTFNIHDDQLLPATPFNLAGAKIGFAQTPNWPAAGSSTRSAMQKAREILQAHGATITEVDLPSSSGFDKILHWHSIILAGEGRASFLGQYRTNKALLHPDIVGHVENSKNISRTDLLEAYDNCARLRPIFDKIATEYDIIITPSVVDEAPKGLGNTGDMSFCSMWTAMHVPAVNLPGFIGETGMPIGLTGVSGRFRDRWLVYVAKAVGEVFEKEGGWVRTVVGEGDGEKRRMVRRGSTGYRST